MIIMKSDYSPVVAAEKQEEDNVRMIQMLLVIAGRPRKSINKYNHLVRNCSIDYTRALGEPDVDGIHAPKQWEAAMEAGVSYLKQAEEILIQYGITIKNVITVSENPGFFSHITTTVYNDFGQMEPIAKIERPVNDTENDTYEDNQTGYGAYHGID